MDSKQLAQAVMKSLRGYIARSLEPITKRMDLIETKAVTIRDLTPDERKALAESMLPHMREAHAKWALDFERSATELMLKAVGNIPEPKDGRDGLTLEHFDAELSEDGRTLKLMLADGQREFVKELRLATPIYRDVYKAGSDYERGDAVTYGGSLWIATKDAPGTPGNGDGWRLAVKRGRDAKVESWLSLSRLPKSRRGYALTTTPRMQTCKG